MFDIKNESLGLIQWIGELVVVPFIYCLQVQYLATFPVTLKWPNAIIFAILTSKSFYSIILCCSTTKAFNGIASTFEWLDW